MGKWMVNTNLNLDMWNGELFDTKEQAIEEGKKQAVEKGIIKFKIGETGSYLKVGIDALRVVEDVRAEMYKEIGEMAENYLEDIPLEHVLELEEKINGIFFEWQKEHKYEPDICMVTNIEEIYV